MHSNDFWRILSNVSSLSGVTCSKVCFILHTVRSRCGLSPSRRQACSIQSNDFLYVHIAHLSFAVFLPTNSLLTFQEAPTQSVAAAVPVELCILAKETKRFCPTPRKKKQNRKKVKGPHLPFLSFLANGHSFASWDDSCYFYIFYQPDRLCWLIVFSHLSVLVRWPPATLYILASFVTLG